MWKDGTTDGQTDMTKTVVVFRNSAKTLQIPQQFLRLLTHYSPLSYHLRQATLQTK